MKEIMGRQVYETLPELIDPRHTAVIAVDIQNDFCQLDGHFGRHGKNLNSTLAALPTMVSFVNDCQALGVRVVFLRQCTLADGRSDSPAWLRFKTRDGKSPDYTIPGTWGWEFVDGLSPGPRDWVIEKYRPDGFLYSCLDQILRANGVETVVILGTTTEGCVESTVRAASYHDYYVVVVKDAVASPNAELHEGSLRLFAARYPLHTSGEILAVFRAAANSAQRTQKAG